MFDRTERVLSTAFIVLMAAGLVSLLTVAFLFAGGVIGYDLGMRLFGFSFVPIMGAIVSVLVLLFLNSIWGNN